MNFFYNSEYFKVKNIDIEENTHYKNEEILDLIPEVIGANIFEINKKTIEETITGGLTWVKEAELRKIFPDRVIVKLTERKPELIIVYKNDYFLMDGEGVILDRITEKNLNSYKDLLLIKNAVSYNINVGEKIAKKNALSCIDIYKAFDIEMKNIINEARLEDNISGDIVFETTDGKEIIFGDSSNTVKKIEILKKILEEEMDYNVIDIRSPESPVLR
ncbi:MAG: FtsQ-type POTRA domain-containing protein [Actinomycetota bacterium]|nr:FtsQ-type POTRA domain-containing protein [Actinomycetota bacterium]